MNRVAEIRIWSTIFAATSMVGAWLTTYADAPSLRPIVDAIVLHGPASELPAHLSLVLGVNAVSQTVPVKQAMLREGAKVHTFNVCAQNHEDLVLIDYDEQNHVTEAYRVTLAGTLRKAVTYSSGEPAVEQTEGKARAGLARELKFWNNLPAQPAATH